MGVGDGFDLTCGDVLAGPFDHVARSIHEMDEVVSVDAHVVAGVEPAVSQHGARRGGAPKRLSNCSVCSSVTFWEKTTARSSLLLSSAHSGCARIMRIGAAKKLAKVAPCRPD